MLLHAAIHVVDQVVVTLHVKTNDIQFHLPCRLVQVVDRLLTNVAVSSNQDLSLTTPNLALKIVALQNESSGQPVVIPTSEEDVVGGAMKLKTMQQFIGSRFF